MIGENIRTERESQGIKQLDMAMDIGVGRNVIYKIEHGLGSLSVEYLYYISQILDRPMDYFMSKHNENDKKIGKVTGIHLDPGEVRRRILELIEGRSYRELCRIERVIAALLEESD